MPESLYTQVPFPFQHNKDILYVHFLYAYEGDCILLELPRGDGHYLNFLIDTGTGVGRLSGIHSLRWFMTHFLPEDNRRIHYALISHWHEDHCAFISQLFSEPELKPKIIWVPHYLLDTFPTDIDKIINSSKKRECLRFTWASKKCLIPGRDMKIEVIGPRNQFLMRKASRKRYMTVDAESWLTWDDPECEDETRVFPLVPRHSEGTINNFSLVVRLSYCGKVALFPGDIQEEGWLSLAAGERGSPTWISTMRKLVKCDLLKIPHHGSTHVPSEIFKVLRSLPQYAVSTYKSNFRNQINPWDELVYPSRNKYGNSIEEVYHTGGELQSRIMCTFAFVPNKAKNDAIIVPLIYKFGASKDPFKLYYFIRPGEVESS